MAYIGAEPVPGQNREVDDISSGFNGNATAFTLQVSSVNVSPESANNILINLGGVLQNPGTDYTIAASTITFTTAPAAGLSFFGLILGAGINTATVADQTIGTSKVLDNAITADKLAHTSVTAGSYTTADITVDAQGRITAAASGTIANAEIADGAVNNAKVNASAAIAGTKISPDFGSQAISTTGGLSINGATVFNEAGANVDFRIEGDADANLFNLDASADAIGIGAAPNTSGMKMEISRSTTDAFVNASDCVLRLLNTDTSADTNQTSLQFTTSSTGSGADSAIVSQAEDASGNSRLEFWTDTNNGMTEKMVINSSGNVGIGTTSPQRLLHSHVGSSAANYHSFTNSTTGSSATDGFLLGINATEEAIIWNYENTDMEFATNSTERMRIDSNGKILIGTTTVQNASMLTVKGTGVTCISTEANLTSAFTHLIFVNPNGNVGDIRTSGSSTVYNTSSDYRLKENIVSISDGITRLKTLKPYTFNFKVNPDTKVDGFFAHEVTAVPEAVTGTKDEVDSDNNPVYQGIDHSKLVPLLTAALQEAIAKIEVLETKVAALEAS